MRRALLAGIALAACARPEISPVVTAVVEPEIRVGLSVSGEPVLGGGAALRVLAGPYDPDGEPGVLAPGVTAVVLAGPDGVSVRQGAEIIASAPSLTVVPADSGMPVRLDGREYRGRILLGVDAADSRLTAVNTLGLEAYLAGVVAMEMGRREAPDLEALKAQAVVSRTWAARALGRWRLRGYDLLSSVADQVYGGTDPEYPLATEAVRQTRGEVVFWDGRLIDAFFHSTCAGRTAEGSEIFVAATAPYLRSVSDESPSGIAWCAISPRWRWREEWNRDALIRMLQQTLPATGGSAALADQVADIRVAEWTPSGRVARLEVVGETGRHEVRRHDIRRLLRPADGPILRSATFTLQITREGGRIVRLAADGAGAGHGVGMCQWGAMGRSRAGFTYREIVSAYFPGTLIGRTY